MTHSFNKKSDLSEGTMGKLFGLLGHPVGHSMSPLMHNDAFTVLGLNHHYQAFDVEPERLKEAVIGMKVLGVLGFNVTIPHKVAIMEYLDEIDEEAQTIGAVNTVVNENGRLIGYNTDGQGYLDALLEEISEEALHQANVLIIGAGGAARAIVTVLSRFGTKGLVICNRTIEKADILASECSVKTRISTLTLSEAEAMLEQFEVIINTTSVGMSPNVDEQPLSLDNLKENALVSDLIYNPLETALLQDAKQRGGKIQNGVGMFVGQGALAFKKWTQVEPDRTRMKEIVVNQLGG